MLTLLNQYGGVPFLKKVITAWHEAVVEERDIRHYFINVTPDILLKDQINYMAFMMRQPDRIYRESPYQSAPLDVQVGSGVFDEVMVVLRKILTESGVHRDLVPRLSTQIVEIVEESRAQAEDIVITSWKPVDITPDNIQEWSNMDELKKLVVQANEKVPSVKFEAIEASPLPQFRTQFVLPYQNGVPTRLFLRAARQFASFFDAGMGIDKKREILRSVLT